MEDEMRERNDYVNVRPYLPHALLATLAVVGVPFAAVVTLVRSMDPDPSTLLVVAVALLSSLLMTGFGIALWKTRPESADIAFGELLIWGWLQRKRADDRLDEGAALLGLDRSGHPTQPVRISPEHQLDVLQDLNEALEAKDPYTHGHSQRVERHSYRTAAAMGLSVDAIEELRLAAALHDVGKIRVPDRVLRKPGRLTKEERLVVEEHVVVGAWMVSSVGSADVVSAVRHHHERWDGRGYPDGLAGTDIPLFSRIIAVSDAYDAITSTRPYRASAGREHAVSVLRAEAGMQFDPMIVNAFVDALPVRLPVAGALVFFAGPAAFGRRIAMWLKRFGAGHLAPAAATLGAIVTLGSFVPAPAIAPLEGPEVVAQAPATTSNVGSGVAVERNVDKPKLEKTRPVRTIVDDVGASRDEDVVLGETIVRPKPHPTPADPKPQPTTKPEPEPTPTPEPADDCTGSADSQGHEKGKGHDKAKGEGHDKHCD
jgi:HD-GYP domain-containing protein (c-di-GMP phosphodiesterase class II)